LFGSFHAVGHKRDTEQSRDQKPTAEPWRQVEIIRTAHGVPHIRAENLRAAGYALAWLQCEDYGARTAINTLEARGQLAQLNGQREAIESDFLALPLRDRMIQTYHLLDQETRDVYDGFAAGINRYIDLHLEQFPPHMPKDFSGYDVAAVDAGGPSIRKASAFLAKVNPSPSPSPSPSASPNNNEGAETNSDDGSNTGLAPSRTKSGKAILYGIRTWPDRRLLRSPCDRAGVIDFYGDFRIGGPFIVVGGFTVTSAGPPRTTVRISQRFTPRC
jgi:acyl-homoserine-lactone acylase